MTKLTASRWKQWECGSVTDEFIYFGSFCRTSMIQPMQLGTDGKMRVMKGEDLHNLAQSPTSQPQVSVNSGSEDEAE